MRHRRSIFGSLILSATVLVLSACDKAPPEPQVSFSKDVQPILARHCLECHAGGEGTKASGLKLTNYDEVMQGTKFGPVIKPGDSLSSTLMILVEGRANSAINMPHGDRPPLSAEEIKTLRLWIEQGAKNN
ncbi:MAG TPA: hypothetical protein ENI97_08420 [Gammaproteobacteria bacterium]|nr:hypothetical protein [Gammaproteobacteria bacterium]